MQRQLFSKVGVGLLSFALLMSWGSSRLVWAEAAPVASASTSAAHGAQGSHSSPEASPEASKAHPTTPAAEPAGSAESPAPAATGQKVSTGRDLADTVLSDERFSTLAQAVKTAGLLPLLKAKGPYTFFAPTDEGWKKLPSDTREKLLADPGRLKAVLTYHILRARVDNVGLHKLRNALTMGGIVQIDYTSGVKVNGSLVTGADIICRNGIIHAVDGVLLPQPRGQKGTAGKKPAGKAKPEAPAEAEQG